MIFRQILVKSFEFMAGHLVPPWGAKVPDPIAPKDLGQRLSSIILINQKGGSSVTPYNRRAVPKLQRMNRDHQLSSIGALLIAVFTELTN